MPTTNIHAWIDEFAAEAYAAQDTERHNLVHMAVGGLQMIRSNPDGALEELELARQAAVRLGEGRWVLFCDHWRMQILLFRKRDLTGILPLARQSVLEASKPKYDNFPQRTCLREDLISFYLSTDPAGYQEDVRSALEDMEYEVNPDSPCFQCLREMQTDFLMASGRFAEAEESALQALRVAATASDYHHAVIAYRHLCEVASQAGDYERLLHWSDAGLLFEDRGADEQYIVELRLWKGVSLQNLGDPASAAVVIREARRAMRRQSAMPLPGCFDALTAYYTAANSPRRALLVRAGQARSLEGKGQPALECRVRLDVLRLLVELGRPIESELAALHVAAMYLADPQPVLDEAESIVGNRS
ncbi:MAG: hypothetical protein ACLQVD_19680 [Capsulimonadaceae bacterium]